MDPLTFENITRNPELIRALMTQARRERAAAMDRLVFQPIRRFFGGGHAARTHLRHPRKAGRAAA
jgi:hypothetical protein